MITVQTASTRIRTPDGSLASGTLTVTAIAAFEYTDGAERRKVAPVPVSAAFVNGQLSAALQLAPTKGADHDRTNLLYRVVYVATEGGRRLAGWTEYWELDAAGPAVLEIDEVVQAQVEGLPGFTSDHTHLNKELLDTYTQTNAQLVGAVQHAAAEASDDPHPGYVTDDELNEAESSLTHSTKGNDYTLVLADAGTVVEMDVAEPNTVTVPDNATVAFPIGTVIEVYQHGSGATTIQPAGGVTIRTALTGVLSSRYSSAVLRKRAVDEWVLSGDLAPA